MSSAESVDGALDALDDLYREIDRGVRHLSAIHAKRLQCRPGCSACCLDDLTVTRIEAERIRRRHGDLLSRADPHPTGACAFLDPDGACRIYADRPTICRSQGLPLRVVFENELEQIEERRDICPLNVDGGPPLETLAEDDLWLVGPEELRVQQLDEIAFGDDDSESSKAIEKNRRVTLRGLFRER